MEKNQIVNFEIKKADIKSKKEKASLVMYYDNCAVWINNKFIHEFKLDNGKSIIKIGIVPEFEYNIWNYQNKQNETATGHHIIGILEFRK